MPNFKQLSVKASAKQQQQFMTFLGGALALFGLGVIGGWYAHVNRIIQLEPSLPPIQFNAALCFLFCGLAMATQPWSRRFHFSFTFGAAGALISGLTLGQFVFHASFGIDQLFFHSYWPEPPARAGRMSPIFALCIFFIALSLLLARRRQAESQRLLIGSLASVVIGVSVFALLGYAFQLPDVHRWGQITRIPPHAACGMGMLALGVLQAAWQNGRIEDERTPRWLPIPLALGVFTVTLVLYFALKSRQESEIADTIKAGAESAKSQISLRMDARVRSLMRMAMRWEFSGRPTKGAWEHDATEYIRDVPDTDAIEWIDASRQVQWVVPLAGNEGKLLQDLTREPRRRVAVEFARDHRKPVITRVVSLFRGGKGFIVYVPIYVGDQFDGWLAGVLKPQSLFDRYFPPAILPGEAIRITEGGTVIYERDAAREQKGRARSAETSVDLHGVTWNVQIWPTPQLAKRLDSPLPEITLLAGAAGSMLLALTVFLAQRAATSANAARRALRDLKAAVAEIKTLTGLLPICASCKRVRDDTGYWSQIESYLCRHSEASFSHGYCPQCAVNACLEFGIAVPAQIQAELDAHNFEA